MLFSDSGGLPAAKQFRGYTGILISGTAYGRGHAGMPYLFPKSEKDYAEGQPRYILLKKEKLNLQTGDTIIQYDRLAPRQGPKEGA